jgi:hypothetical protein
MKAKYLEKSKEIFDALFVDINERIVYLTTTSRMTVVKLVEDIVKLAGDISEGELLAKTYRYLSHGTQQFYEALAILKKSGKIRIEGSPATGLLIKYAG